MRNIKHTGNGKKLQQVVAHKQQEQVDVYKRQMLGLTLADDDGDYDDKRKSVHTYMLRNRAVYF